MQGRAGRRRRAPGRTCPPARPGVLAISGPTVFPGYVIGRDEDGHVLDGLRQAGRRLAGHRRPRPRRRGRLRLPHRPGQGPHHPRRPQHRPRDHRGRAARPPAGHRGRRRRPTRRARRRGTRSPTSPSPPAPRVTEDELRDWAAERVAERAAAPKTVTVLDALPVTAVGKPYKLRAARRRHPPRRPRRPRAGSPARTVDTAIEDGSVVATVTVTDDTDEAAVEGGPQPVRRCAGTSMCRPPTRTVSD